MVGDVGEAAVNGVVGDFVEEVADFIEDVEGGLALIAQPR